MCFHISDRWYFPVCSSSSLLLLLLAASSGPDVAAGCAAVSDTIQTLPRAAAAFRSAAGARGLRAQCASIPPLARLELVDAGPFSPHGHMISGELTGLRKWPNWCKSKSNVTGRVGFYPRPHPPSGRSRLYWAMFCCSRPDHIPECTIKPE